MPTYILLFYLDFNDLAIGISNLKASQMSIIFIDARK